MKFFIFSLFLLLLFDSPQGSTVAHRRSIRALNTTLETDFDGVYERRNPCTNAEVEKSSYKASHEFQHYSKENNWSEYGRKCTAIISGFLQAIGNLVRFNHEQNGIFNFHINTSISQKQDRHSEPYEEQACASLPTIVIEAADGEILPNSSLKNAPVQKPCIRQAFCLITGSNDKIKPRQRACANQEQNSQQSACKPCKPVTLNSLEKEVLGSKNCRNASTYQPEPASTDFQGTTTQCPTQSVERKEVALEQDENITPDASQIPSTPFPLTGNLQTEENSPADFSDLQQNLPTTRTEFYETYPRPESSPENYDINVMTTQPGNQITSSTISGQYNDGDTLNIPITTENLPFHSSSEPRITFGGEQLFPNQYQPSVIPVQQPPVTPEQPFSDNLGEQEYGSLPLANSFAPASQFPTTVLSPEDRFNPLKSETQPYSNQERISPVLNEPPVSPKSNSEVFKTFDEEITPAPSPSPEFSDLSYTKTPLSTRVSQPVGISQPSFIPNVANSFSLPPPNAMQIGMLNAAVPVFVPPSQRPQNNLMNTDPPTLSENTPFQSENQGTTLDPLTTVNTEYDELSDPMGGTQPSRGENTFSVTETNPTFDYGASTPAVQLSPIQLALPENLPAKFPSDSLTIAPQSDISNGPSPINGGPLNDNQASDPTAFTPGQSYPSSPFQEGQTDVSFEPQQTTPSYDSEPILNENTNGPIVNIPSENTGEELQGNSEFVSPSVADFPPKNQFRYSDPVFNPTQETTASYNNPTVQTRTPKIQPPQPFLSTSVGPQWVGSKLLIPDVMNPQVPGYIEPQLQLSTNTPFGRFSPTFPVPQRSVGNFVTDQPQFSPNKTYVTETVTTETTSEIPLGQFPSTLPTEQQPDGIYETEQSQMTTAAPYEEPQTQTSPQSEVPAENANDGITGLPSSDFYEQQAPITFAQLDSQPADNAPFPLFPSTYSPEQQPVGTHNIMQSQPNSADPQTRTTETSVSSVEDTTTPFPDLYNQQTPNTFGESTPIDQFPSRLPPQQQPLGNYEATNPQTTPSSYPEYENPQLQTNEGPEYLPAVETGSTIYDQQSPSAIIPTQSSFRTNQPFEQFPSTSAPVEDYTTESTSAVTNDDPQGQKMASEFQSPLEYANEGTTSLPSSIFYRQQTPDRFLPSESQLGDKAPLDQLPSTQFPEHTEGGYQTTQFQSTPVTTYEDAESQTTTGESRLGPENSEDGTTRFPDPIPYNVEPPNTFIQPDSQLRTNEPFNPFASEGVPTELTTIQSEATTKPSRGYDNQFSLPSAPGALNQETPTEPESQLSSNAPFGQLPSTLPPTQQTTGNNQAAEQSTIAPTEDPMQTIVGPGMQPSQEFGGKLPDYFMNGSTSKPFVQPDLQFESSPSPSQLPGNRPSEQPLIQNSEMNERQTTSPDPFVATQPQTITSPEFQHSPEYGNGNGRMSEVPNFYSQQYPTTSITPIVPNSQLRGSTQFPSTLPPEQQPIVNYDLSRPQLTSVTTYENETTATTRFPTTVEPQWQPSQGYPNQYWNNGRTDLTAFTNAPSDGFPSTFSPELRSTSELSYEDPQIQRPVTPSPEFTDDRMNEPSTFNVEQNATPSDPQLPENQPINQIQPESQLKSNTPFNQIPSTVALEQQSTDNYEMPQSQPIAGDTSEDPQEATKGTESQTPPFYPNERTRLPGFNFYNQQTPITFVPGQPQPISNPPFGQFLTTFPPRQQPVGNYEVELFRSPTVSSDEGFQTQMTAPTETEPAEQYSYVTPTGRPDQYTQETPLTFVQPTPQFGDNAPFPQFSEQHPIGNYEIPQPQSSTVSAYEDETATPQWQPSEDYVNDGTTGLPISVPVNQQTPSTFVPPESRVPTDAGLRDLPSTISQEYQADESSSPMEYPTSPAPVTKPEAFPTTPEISGEEAFPYNIQPSVSQNDLQGEMDPTMAYSNQDPSYTTQAQFEDPSTSYQNRPELNNQGDLIPSTEASSDFPLTTLAPGKESFGSTEQTSETSPFDPNTSFGYKDQPLPSSTFASPHPDRVFNDMTTSAMNSEQRVPVIGAEFPAAIPMLVTPNRPYGYTPPVKPYFRGEQPQITSIDPSVTYSDQPPATNYPSVHGPVYNQNLGPSQPIDNGMLEQNPDIQPSAEFQPPQPTQFSEDGQSTSSESPAADQPNTDFITVSPTPDSSLSAPQLAYTTPQPIPFIPEMGPKTDFPIPNEFYERPSVTEPYVGDDSSQRKFSPRPILPYGNENPPLTDLETTLSPEPISTSVPAIPEETSEPQFEQFSPESSVTPLSPSQEPSHFENPTGLPSSTEMQPSGTTISATPESELEEQTTPTSFEDVTQNQQDLNQPPRYPNQPFTAPPQPMLFSIPVVGTQFRPQPSGSNYQSQNLQQPLYPNEIPSQDPNLEEQVIPALPQNENRPTFVPGQTSEPQDWKVSENPQPTEQLYTGGQKEEVNDATSLQPSSVYPMNYQPSSDVPPVIPYQSSMAPEPLPYSGTTAFPSEQQIIDTSTEFNKRITPTVYQTTSLPTEATEMSLSPGKFFSEQQMTPEPNDWNPSVDSFVTTQPTSAQTVSEYDSTVSYGATQPRSELESQSLISAAGNDQPLPATFPASQTETTLPYSNDPSVDLRPSFAVSEMNPSDSTFSTPSFKKFQTSTTSEDVSPIYNPQSVTPENSGTSDTSDFVPTVPYTFQSKPKNVYNSFSPHKQFPLTVSPQPTVSFPQTAIYNPNPLATTDYSLVPFKSTTISETQVDSYTSSPKAFDPMNEAETQETEENESPAPFSGPSTPLNYVEETPLAVTGETPSPVSQVTSPYRGETSQPTFKSDNVQEEISEPQPQPSTDYTTEIQDYKTTDDMGQTSRTFDYTSPSQSLNPEAFTTTSAPTSITIFEPERQTPFAYTPGRMNTNGEYLLPGTQTSQSSGEKSATTGTYLPDDIYTTDPVSSNPTEDMELTSDYSTSPNPYDSFSTLPVEAPINPNIPLREQYEPQPIQENPGLIDNVSPQIQSTTTVNYDGETNTYQSSPQPQTTLRNVDQLSDDDIASISPGKLETESPKFEPTPTFIPQTRTPEFESTQYQTTPVFETTQYQSTTPESESTQYQTTPGIGNIQYQATTPEFETTQYQTTPEIGSTQYQPTTPEFESTQYQTAPQPQPPPTDGYPLTTYDQESPSTLFVPSTTTQTFEPSEIYYTDRPVTFQPETNEAVSIKSEPSNPQETLNQTTQPEPAPYSEKNLNEGATTSTVFSGDFTPSYPPFERPSQTQFPVTEYDNTRGQTSDFPSSYQPTVFDTQTPPAMTPSQNFLTTLQPQTQLPLNHFQTSTTVIPQENIETNFPEVTNSPPETEITDTDKINKDIELRLPEDTTLPPEDSSTTVTESSSYSDSSVYNVRKRPNGRLFDYMSTLPPSNDQRVQTSSPPLPNSFNENPEQQQIVVENPTTFGDYDLSTQSPETRVTHYDETTTESLKNVQVTRQPFNDPTEQPGLYSAMVGVSAQPQTDSPLDLEEGSTRRPMTFPSNSEPFTTPSPPMQGEPHSNPLFDTLESHLIVPLPEPQQPSKASSSPVQEPLYVDPRKTSPVPNESFSLEQSNQNQFSTIPPYFRRPEFDQNFVTSQPQPNAGDVMSTPQPDSLVSDLTAPSNEPGEDYVSCSCNGTSPIMCPFDPVLKGNMTAPSYYILISKLPGPDNTENYQVEKVYLGDGMPLNCSFGPVKTFPTSLYTPVQLRSTGTVKLRTKSDFA